MVAVFDPHTEEWGYQECWGNLFGLMSAVWNYNRTPKFMQALYRRWLRILAAIYFDDVSLQDLKESKGTGQRHLRAMSRMMGVKLSPEKAVDMCASDDFLGLIHCLEGALKSGTVPMQARGKCKEAERDLVQHCLSVDECTPADASKIRGMKTFTAAGDFGKVGRVALGPLKKTQYSDREPWTLSGRLKRGLILIQQLDEIGMRREVQIFGAKQSPILVASDGRADEWSAASAAVLAVDTATGTRVGICMVLPKELEDRWSHKQFIAEVETVPIVVALLEWSKLFEGRDVIWWEDNAVAWAQWCVEGATLHLEATLVGSLERPLGAKIQDKESIHPD